MPCFLNIPRKHPDKIELRYSIWPIVRNSYVEQVNVLAAQKFSLIGSMSMEWMINELDQRAKLRFELILYLHVHVDDKIIIYCRDSIKGSKKTILRMLFVIKKREAFDTRLLQKFI